MWRELNCGHERDVSRVIDGQDVRVVFAPLRSLV